MKAIWLWFTLVATYQIEIQGRTLDDTASRQEDSVNAERGLKEQFTGDDVAVENFAEPLQDHADIGVERLSRKNRLVRSLLNGNKLKRVETPVAARNLEERLTGSWSSCWYISSSSWYIYSWCWSSSSSWHWYISSSSSLWWPPRCWYSTWNGWYSDWCRYSWDISSPRCWYSSWYCWYSDWCRYSWDISSTWCWYSTWYGSWYSDWCRYSWDISSSWCWYSWSSSWYSYSRCWWSLWY